MGWYIVDATIKRLAFKYLSNVDFRSRVKTEHLLTNTSRGLVTSQVVRIDQPSILTSGLYHCKVATFTMEEITTHSLLIFGEFKLETDATSGIR